MSSPTSRWIQCALDTLQIEEYIAKYVLSFRRSWLRKHRTNDLIKDTLLTARFAPDRRYRGRQQRTSPQSEDRLHRKVDEERRKRSWPNGASNTGPR